MMINFMTLLTRSKAPRGDTECNIKIHANIIEELHLCYVLMDKLT